MSSRCENKRPVTEFDDRPPRVQRFLELVFSCETHLFIYLFYLCEAQLEPGS